ncbi:MAG: hypothetical protein ACFFEN_10880 [Candidatus Thorarchaeota archaeon]
MKTNTKMRKIILTVLGIIFVLSIFTTQDFSDIFLVNEKEGLDNINNKIGSEVLKASSNGGSVCTAINNQFIGQICSDGSGGAIIVWKDERNDPGDIYVQRINSAGNVNWAPDGIAICTANNEQRTPRICSDGVGGAIIVWSDKRNGLDYDIYAQRIDSNGNIQWTSNGTVICMLSEDQWATIINDGAEGAVITWYSKNLLAATGENIFSQRINSSGILQWPINGVPICTNINVLQPKTCIDSTGGAIITWTDFRNSPDYHVYTQRVNGSGITVWITNGTTICTTSANQIDQIICDDGIGGAIIAWLDDRNTYNNIYTQRIDSTGALTWGNDGIEVCNLPYSNYDPIICSDGNSGAIIAWADVRSSTGFDIYAQRVASNGNTLWNVNGVAITTADEHQTDPQICGDGTNGAIVVWEDERDAPYTDIYAQRVSSSGGIQWISNGVPICTAENFQSVPQIVNDGSGGAIISWQDSRATPNIDIYVNLIDSNGDVKWPPTEGNGNGDGVVSGYTLGLVVCLISIISVILVKKRVKLIK